MYMFKGSQWYFCILEWISVKQKLFLMQIDLQKPKHVSKILVDRRDFVYQIFQISLQKHIRIVFSI